MKKEALGRGLEALIGGEPNHEKEPAGGPRVVYLPTDKLSRNQYQPRKYFDRNSIDDLEKSIRESGIIQPLLVRKTGDSYQLIAGERRLIAARQAGLTEVPALIRDVDEGDEILEIALIENIQREDLNPVEQARSYRRLIDEFGLTQEEVSRKVGKSRPSIANIVRLLELEDEIQGLLESGQLNFGQARTLLAVPKGKARIKLARRVVREGIAVRRLEKIISGESRSKSGSKKYRRETDPSLIELKETLRNKLKTKIEIKKKRGGGGSIEIKYFSIEDLNRIIDIII